MFNVIANNKPNMVYVQGKSYKACNLPMKFVQATPTVGAQGKYIAIRREPVILRPDHKQYIIKKVAACPIRKRTFAAKMVEVRRCVPDPVLQQKRCVLPAVITIDEEESSVNVGSVVRAPNGKIYQVKQCIGKGTFGKTFEVIDSVSQKTFAMKVLADISQSQILNNQKETDMFYRISSICHPSVPLIRCLESFKFGYEKCFIMDKMDMNLYKFMIKTGPMPIQGVAEVAYQLLTSVLSLNRIGLVHSDLKPENIMFVDRDGMIPNEIKVIDYGLVSKIEDISSPNNRGLIIQTPLYRSPEVLLGLSLNEKVDIWSIGMILYELYVNRPLYTAKTDRIQLREIAEVVGLPKNYYKGKYFNKFLVYSEETGADHWIKEYQVIPEVKEMKDFGKMLNLGHSMLSTGKVSSADYDFLGLLRHLLVPEAEFRISAEDALRHEFFECLRM